jgi:hypothetical protein
LTGLRRKNQPRGTRTAIGLAAAIATFSVAGSVALAGTTSDGYADVLERICAGQRGTVVAAPDYVSCRNVAPAPYRAFALDVADHICEELLGSWFSSGPAFAASDGSVLSWTCARPVAPTAIR